MKFPQFVSRAEVKRYCAVAQQPGQRYGQAVANKYDLPKDLEDMIYESDSDTFVWGTLYHYFVKQDYQNGG